MNEVKLWTLLSPTAKGEPFNIQPATADEIKAAHDEVCEREGMKRYELCGQVLWLNEQAGAMLNYLTREYHTPREGAEGREGGQG